MEPVDLEAMVAEIKRLGMRTWLLNELTKAFEVARKGKTHTFDEHSFEINWAANLVSLRDAILEHRYEVSPSMVFVVFDPMVREIFAASFRDRVVHHFLYHMQGGWWDKHFIYDSYSCRVGKGVKFAGERVQKMMRRASEGGKKTAYVMKMDIKGYFMSLPREKMYRKVEWGLLRQFEKVMHEPMGRQLFAICAYLWETVLMDDPTIGAKKRGPAWNWDAGVLPASKSLYSQPPGYGLPIGNVTSQLASNIYLDEFDRFVRFELGYRNYGRYVDDFVIVSSDKEKMLSDVSLMSAKLSSDLELTLHPSKRYFQDVRKGVAFAGSLIYPRHIHPGRRLLARFPAALEKLIAGEGELDTVVSYLGLMRHLDSERYVLREIEKQGCGHFLAVG